MHILVMIFGLLLLVFGGGCTLFVVGLGLTDPVNFLRDTATILQILLPFGVLPLVVGWLLFRYGLRKDREKRKATAVKNDPHTS